MKDRLKELNRIFHPKVVAIVGDKRLNNNYMWLRSMSTFQGKLYSVNIDPNEAAGIEALGITHCKSLLDIPEEIDYVYVSVPREVIPRVLDDCIRKKVGGVALFTSGYHETNTDEGRRLAEQLTQVATQAGLNLIGPNCVGIFNPRLGVRNAPELYHGEGGPLGFISQSGRNLVDLAAYAGLHGVKVSKGVSYGNAYIFDSPDFLEFLLADEETRLIGMYIEGARDGRRLFEVLREGAGKKPILIWKGGLTPPGARATASHTGSLAESAAVWEAVLRQCGAIQAEGIEDLVDVSKLLMSASPLKGPRMGVISLNGGQCVAMADTFTRAGLEVPPLSEAASRRLAPFSGLIGASLKNPIDLGLPWYIPQTLGPLLEVLGEEEGIDGVAMELPTLVLQLADGLAPGFSQQLFDTILGFQKRFHKPFLVILPPSPAEQKEIEVRDLLMRQGISSFNSYFRCGRALKKVADYYGSRERKARREIESERNQERLPGKPLKILEQVGREGRRSLNEVEAKKVLAAAGIPVVPTRPARSEEEAAAIAREMGFPVVLKVLSPDVIHKSDIGGVRLGLKDEDEVTRGYREILAAVRAARPEARLEGVSVQPMARPGIEMVVGTFRDPQFGPVVMFGLGGVFIEILKDVAFRVAPLSSQDAEEMIREVRGFPLLEGYRGREPVDLSRLKEVLLRVSDLALANPTIREMDLNPLFGYRDEVVAVDARMILNSAQYSTEF